MKIALMVLLATWLAPLAGAQGTTGAGQPAPSTIEPTGDKPAQPSGDKPAQPTSDKPAIPSDEKPAQPSGDKPDQPPSDRPAHPWIITKPEQTTPEVLQAPESEFFRPFHSDEAAQPDKKAVIPEPVKPVETVSGLKKKQTAEIKALRLNLKDRPKPEIQKAVESMKAEHQAALKALQDANKAETGKNKKIRIKPVTNKIKSKNID